ncbi:MAG: DUF389 domain-containing protein [Acidobacteriota bacterium]
MVVSISSGTDAAGTIDSICKGVDIRGANIWMLVCSAVLASIGLDLNSTAVIIGAMLISPLMSPILGVGLGVGILDRALLRESLKNLALATFISLAVSFLYFLVSPLGQLTPELSARTTPTILDVGVALFGGVAGIVAGSRKDKTSAIPGVAIATALMPPVCTAGFGLAKFSTSVFLGAFYLYFINAFFISLATYLVVIWLKFPRHEELDEGQNVRVRRLIIGFAVVIIIPSTLIFYNVLSKLKFDAGVKSFVNKEIRNDDRQPVQWNVAASSRPELKVYTVGNGISVAEKEKLQTKLADYGLGSLQLKLVPLNVSPDEFRKLASSVDTDISQQLKLIQSVEDERKAEIEQLRKEVDDIRAKTDPHLIFLGDVKGSFHEIKDILWQEPSAPPPNNTKYLVVTFMESTADTVKNTIKTKIADLARSRWANENIQIDEAVNNENAPVRQPRPVSP